MLDAVGEGHATAPQLAATGLAIRTVLTGLGELEARGLVRVGSVGATSVFRELGGRRASGRGIGELRAA